MRRYIRVIIASVLCLAASNLLPSSFFTSVIVTLLLVSPVVYLLVFPGESEKKVLTQVRQERIVNLHNNSLGDVFVPSKYPDYKMIRSSAEGNDYMSVSGGIICTKYETVERSASVKDSGTAKRHILCIALIILFTVVLHNGSPEPDYPTADSSRELDYSAAESETDGSPDCVGLIYADAVALLEDSGWDYDFDTDIYDGTERIGTILTQDVYEDDKRVTLYINQGGFEDDVVIYSDAYIESDTADVVLCVGDSVMLEFTCYGELPDSFYFNASYYPDIDLEWQDWSDDYTCSMLITGTTPCQGYLRVYLVDSSDESYWNYWDVFITVI